MKQKQLFRTTITSKDWAAVGVILGCTVLLIALFAFVVQKAQARRMAELDQQITETRALVTEATLWQAKIKDLREKMEKINLLVDEFSKRLPATRELPQLINEFERMAREAEVRVDVKPESPLRDVNKETIPYTVKAYGSFHQIARFVNALERFERYLKVSDLKIGEEKITANRAESEAQFTLSTYRFIESAPRPSAPGVQPSAGSTSAPGTPAAEGASPEAGPITGGAS